MDYLLIFLIGLLASFFGSFMSGTTSLMAFTGLYALGLPSQLVLSTFRIGVFGFEAGGIWQYQRARKIDWSVFWPLVTMNVLGALVGAFIVVSINELLIEKVIGVAILIFIPLLILNPKLGLEKRVVSRVRRWVGHIAKFFMAIWGASFSIGIGYLHVINNMYFYGHTLLEAKASGKLPAVISDVFVLSVFYFLGVINWGFGLSLLLGMLLGAVLGTRIAIKLGDTWLRYILLGTIALFSLKLILGI